MAGQMNTPDDDRPWVDDDLELDDTAEVDVAVLLDAAESDALDQRRAVPVDDDEHD
jgi:hypothetical protein